MIYLILVGFVVSFGIVTARAARQRTVPHGALAATGLRVGGFIALVRLVCFWCGLALYTGHADWRQVGGYALLNLSAAVELALAAFCAGRPGPPLLVAGMIVLTSAGLGFAWAWLRNRPPFRGAA